MKFILLTIILSLVFSSTLVADTSTCPTEAVDDIERTTKKEPSVEEDETKATGDEANVE